jgi:hypothetical protein
MKIAYLTYKNFISLAKGVLNMTNTAQIRNGIIEKNNDR